MRKNFLEKSPILSYLKDAAKNKQHVTNKKNKIYLRSYRNNLAKLIQVDGDTWNLCNINIISRTIFYGVKYFANVDLAAARGYRQYKDLFAMHTLLIGLIASLTPVQFLRIFPIEKDFKTCGYKIVFFTMCKIDDYGMERIIGISNVQSFLFDFINKEISEFALKGMQIRNEMLRIEEKTEIMQSVADLFYDNQIENAKE